MEIAEAGLTGWLFVMALIIFVVALAEVDLIAHTDAAEERA